MVKISGTVYLASLTLVILLSGCTDHENAKKTLVGSWEVNFNNGLSACIVYQENNRFHLFNRSVLSQDQLESLQSMLKASEKKTTTILKSEATSYSAGYWGIQRGLRLWQKGSLVVNKFGHELPRTDRVLSKNEWQVIKFENKDHYTSIKLEDRKNRFRFNRVENCDLYSAGVDLNLVEPVWNDV